MPIFMLWNILAMANINQNGVKFQIQSNQTPYSFSNIWYVMHKKITN